MTEEEYQQSSKYIFRDYKKHLVEHLLDANRYVVINNILKKYNGAFLHPNMIGAEIQDIERLENEGKLTNEVVFAIFSRSFFDLRSTAYFIETHCKNNPYLAPFCQLIDQAVFLCLQRDYAGGINILIPVIEGSLRQYLVNAMGLKNERNMKTKDLLKIFGNLEANYLEAHRQSYLEGRYGPHQHAMIILDENRINALLKLKKKYLRSWFSIFTDYLENNLYQHTQGQKVDDALNRHLITHLFSHEMYYTLENFLRVYHCLYFLSWAFQMGAGVARFPQENQISFEHKWEVFEKVHELSVKLAETKSNVYEQYPDFNKQAFLKKHIDTGTSKRFQNRRKIHQSGIFSLLDGFLNKK